MSMLAKYLDHVKSQAQYHQKKADELKATPGYAKKHRASSAKFKQMAVDLELADRRLDEAEALLKPVRLLRSINLGPDELDSLPEELLRELSDSDRTEREIYKVIEECGGIASLDRILLRLYQRTGEIHKRSATTSRLYRMSLKGYAYPVPGRKGVYATKQLSEAEVAKLFDEAAPTPTPST